jgi:RimJ/RimL family protein N-acetyltransferase
LIRTERLILRRWQAADRPAWAAMNADPEVRRYFHATLSREESDASAARLDAAIERDGFGFWALELAATGRFIGFTGITRVTFEAPFTPAVEAGWRLARDCWGQGLATEAARAALEFGFNRLGLEEIVAFAVPGNTASRRVMEKIGMQEDPEAAFDHPNVPAGSPVRRHVLYRARRGSGWV